MSEHRPSGSDRPSGSPDRTSDAQQMMLYDVNKKSMLVSYVLWFFLGFVGAHRFYLGHSGSAWGIIGLFVFGWIFVLAVPFLGLALLFVLGIWLLVDIFLIIGMVKEQNQQVMARINHGTMR